MKCHQASLDFDMQLRPLEIQKYIYTVFLNTSTKHQSCLHSALGTSPDRLPPAGIRRATSIGDTRLLKPSDDSQYMRSPEREQK